MYLVNEQDSRIAQYTFGKSISQFGLTVFSNTNAKQGKKIFGNDPDPTKEVVFDSAYDIIEKHIKANPKGKAAGYHDILKEVGPMVVCHYRTVSFGSTWRSDSLKPAHVSFVYHNGAHSHFRMPGICRLTSQEPNGVISCSGYEDTTTTGRRVHFLKQSQDFTPHGIGSIIIPMHDCWYHKTKLVQHFPFPISEEGTVQLTVDKPTVIVEFTKEKPDTKYFMQTWLDQIEDGLIEIVPR